MRGGGRGGVSGAREREALEAFRFAPRTVVCAQVRAPTAPLSCVLGGTRGERISRSDGGWARALRRRPHGRGRKRERRPGRYGPLRVPAKPARAPRPRLRRSQARRWTQLPRVGARLALVAASGMVAAGAEAGKRGAGAGESEVFFWQHSPKADYGARVREERARACASGLERYSKCVCMRKWSFEVESNGQGGE